MSFFSNPSKSLKRNFSWDSWKRGKGVIGHWNPAIKMYKDFKKFSHGFKSKAYGNQVGKFFSMGNRSDTSSVYSTSSTSARSIADMA